LSCIGVGLAYITPRLLVSFNAGLHGMLLRVEGLSAGFRGRRVLRGVGLRVGDGEVHVLVGPNGAGKSTLLKAVAGVRSVEVYSGRIVYAGRDVTGEPAWSRARMGIVLVWQQPPRIRGLRARSLAEEIARRSGADLEGLARLLGVEGLLDKHLHRGLSGGESRRLELFLALLQRPRLLLVDEVDSGVDADNLGRIASALNAAAGEGVSMVIVTHTGAIAERLERIDRLHVLMDGRIVYSGDPGVLRRIVREGYGWLRSGGGVGGGAG